MNQSSLTIGQLARRVNIAPRTLRYYDKIGLLPSPARSPGGYRLYSELDVRRARLVRQARALDIGLADIQELVTFASIGSCGNFRERLLMSVRQKQVSVDERINDLKELKRDLRGLETRLARKGPGHDAGHTMLECSPETCECLGDDAQVNVAIG